MRSNKIYFSHYGEVVSLDRRDAIKLANDALKGKGWNLDSYPSYKLLRNKESRKEDQGFKYNGVWKEVNHCLDWEKDDWEYFLENI